jgi:DNA-binding transcriptional MerR regulator
VRNERNEGNELSTSVSIAGEQSKRVENRYRDSVTSVTSVTRAAQSGSGDVRFRTAEVAKLADVSLRQLQLWEEKRLTIASRSGRVRLYTASQTLFVIVLAELRRRGLSFQRLHRLSVALGQLVDDHNLLGQRTLPLHAFILTDGRQIQFADSPNKTLELVLNFSRPVVCVSLADCLHRLEKTELV